MTSTALLFYIVVLEHLFDVLKASTTTVTVGIDGWGVKTPERISPVLQIYLFST